MFSFEQLKYCCIIANKAGGRGKQLKMIIPPADATRGEFDFSFVFETPKQDATDGDWKS